MEACRSGDDVALQDLLSRHYGRLRAFLRLRIDPKLRAKESVSDLVQSVCREVLRQEGKFVFMGEAAFRAWLFEAALLKLRQRRAHYLTQRRDVRREVELASDGAHRAELAAAYRTTLDPLGATLRKEEMEALERAFDDLDEEPREVLTLRLVCGLSYREIADRLDRSELALRKVASRARARLAAQLARALPD